MRKISNQKVIVIPEGRYYIKAQVARLQNVTPECVEHWILSGYLPALRAGGIGWLVEEGTLAAFKPPPRGPRSSDSPYPPPRARKR